MSITFVHIKITTMLKYFQPGKKSFKIFQKNSPFTVKSDASRFLCRTSRHTFLCLVESTRKKAFAVTWAIENRSPCLSQICEKWNSCLFTTLGWSWWFYENQLVYTDVRSGYVTPLSNAYKIIGKSCPTCFP